MTRVIVVFPAPLAPSTETTSPGCTRRLTPSRAIALPYLAVMPSSSSSGGSAVSRPCPSCRRSGVLPSPR